MSTRTSLSRRGTQEACRKAPQRVRVSEEDPVHKLKYGEEGTLQAKEDGTAVVQLKAAKYLTAVRLPLSLLTPLEGLKKATPLRTLARVSREKKRALLTEAGVINPAEDQVEILAPKDLELADFHIDLYGGAGQVVARG